MGLSSFRHRPSLDLRLGETMSESTAARGSTTGEDQSPVTAAGGHTELPDLEAHQPSPPAKIERQATTVQATGVNLFYGDFHAVQDVDMTIEPNKVTAF